MNPLLKDIVLEVESTTHSQKKKDVIHERKKKKFPSNNSDLNEYLKILPG